MWFAFGIITLISFSIFFGYQRFRAKWKGVPTATNGIQWQHKLLRSKYGITGALIGIEAPKGYEFSFKQETWYDRLFKSIGLSVEHQVGSTEFDELVYVVSDDTHLHRQVSANRDIVDAVLRVFRLDETHKCTVKELRCGSGRLWVRVKARDGFDKGHVPHLGSEIVPWMRKIADALATAPVRMADKWRDPFVIKAAIMLAISTGLAVNGGVQLLRLMWTNLPFTVDSDQLLVHAAIVGGSITAALVLATLFLLGRTARAHLVLIEIVLVGSFGAVATAFTEMRDANMEFDGSNPVIYPTKTVDKHISRGRRSTSYYLHLEDWNRREPTAKVKVSSDFYRQVAVGDELLAFQKPGYLGYRWVEALHKQVKTESTELSFR